MAEKRRATKRQKSQGVVSKAVDKKPKEKAPVKSFDGELALFFLGTGIIFLLCSILSLSPYQSDGTLDASKVSNNLMGPAGHFVATLLRGSLGWSSFIIVGWLSLAIALNIDKLKKKGKKQDDKLKYRFEIRFLSIVLSIICFSTFWALFFKDAGGGSIGITVGKIFEKYIGKLGTAILSISFFLVSCSFALNYTISDLGKTFFKSLGTFLKYVFLVIPYYLYASCVFVLQNVFSPFKKYFSIFFPKKDEDLEEDFPLPKPRRRKNIIQEDLDGEESDDEKYYNRDFEIVVKRNNSKSSESSLKEVDKAIRNAQKNSMAWCDDEKYINYIPPSLSLLKKSSLDAISVEDDDELVEKSRIIEKKLKDFGILGHVKEVHLGPVITLFEFEPAPGVRVGRIAALQGDLAMGLKASSIRIIAPIPKKGTVGIEVPNKNRDLVRLRDILESEEFVKAQSILSVPIGKDIYGEAMVADIASMPHLLIAGATGTGKSVFINTLLISLLYRANPAELGLILVDPKILELSVYEGIPHLKVPVVTTPKQAHAVLLWAIDEMERRYKLMQKYGVRNIDGYNAIVRGDIKLDTPIRDFKKKNYIELNDDSVVEDGIVESEKELQDSSLVGGSAEKLRPLAKIVIVIDELADLMFSVGRDIEDAITRLAQKARASGIHLILATQRPSVDVITGLIKANFPARISFRVSSSFDSKTILDSVGAEKLLGKGDMLYMEPGGVSNKRVHGAFVSDSEVMKVINSIKQQAKPNYDEQIIKMCEKLSKDNDEADTDEDEERDELYDKAVEFVIQKGQASTSMIQRVFRIGYNRAARIIDSMERDGIIGPMDGAKPREVFANSNDRDEDMAHGE